MKKTVCIVGSLLLLVGCGEASGPTGNNGNNNNNSNRNPVCGDGHVDPGESCDDGAANSDSAPDACRTDCRHSYCGDSVLDSGEECDGNNLNSKHCTDFGGTTGVLGCNECVFDTSQCSTCGDGEAEGSVGDPEYETCDGSDLRGEDCVSIGQAQGTLRCDSNCGWDISGCVGGGTTCGNGILEPGEGCDDGNLTGCDGCSPTCVVEECGNGVIECNEGCDDGNSSNEDGCLNTCVVNACGDGYVNPATEQCDDGNQNVTDACPDGPQGTCLFASCGDGYLEAGVEGCDDGNQDNNDGCPDGVGGTCELAVCGDGHIQTGTETCEPSLDPTCHNNCTNYCGDGVVGSNAFENCDDNISCTPDCQRYCGDGVVDTDLGEVCDDNFGPAPPYTGGPPGDGNSAGAWSRYCMANCQPVVCGDGICHGWDEPTTCPQDCP